MLSSPAFDVHLEITKEAPDRISESSWLVLFNEEVAYPSEKVARDESGNQKTVGWLLSIFLFGDVLFVDLVEEDKPLHKGAIGTKPVEKLGNWV